MKITHCKTTGAWYIQLVDKIKKGEASRQKRIKNATEGPELILDYDKSGRLLGIEILET